MGKGGKLMFKGEKKKKKKSKSKHSKRSSEEPSSSAIPVIAAAADAPSSSAVNEDRPSAASAQTKIQKGKGTITTSGTVVTGIDTAFEKQLGVGDAILVDLPQSGKQEMRVITMRLSNTSVNLSSAFTESLKSPQSFSFVPKPRNLQKERKQKEKERQKTKELEERHAFGTYGGAGRTLVYREKTTSGSYRIRQEKVGSQNSRGDLLQMRSKKTSDKYC
uniref:Uncharacterized protein n=1 Tax=Craspedostauros australis TaxID=1486917 RepID=A0A7R9WZR2_9STRA